MRNVAIAIIILLLPAATRAQRVGTDLGYSVFRIDTEVGHGSGFLVDSKRGLVITNYHVVRLGSGISRFISVALPAGGDSEIRVKANVFYANAEKDIAVLQVSRARTIDLPEIEVPENDLLSVLDPVVAIGSPLSLGMQFTRGYVSSLDDEFGIGDFLIQPGNSGGPVLRMETGELAGVATFGVGEAAGFVRTSVVRDAIQRTGGNRLPMGPPPDALPAYSLAGPYPAELLLERVLGAYDDRKSRRECENEFGRHPWNWPMEWCNQDGNDRFRVDVDTPVTNYYHALTQGLHREENRRRRRGRKITDDTYRESIHFYEWYNSTTRTNTTLAPAVSISVMPKVGQTGGSIAKQIAVASVSGALAGLSGVYVPTAGPGANLKFKGEFYAIRVFAGERELTPVRRLRSLYQVQQEGYIEMRDEAYGGIYQYDMRDFISTDEITIEIFDARRMDKPMDKRFMLNSRHLIMKQIHNDFRALESYLN